MKRLALVFLGAALAACDLTVNLGGRDGGRCGPSNCTGCCDVNGACQLGFYPNACGFGGAACLDCSAYNQVCGGGTCRASGPSTTDGGGGGGSDGGGNPDSGGNPDAGRDGGSDAGSLPDAGRDGGSDAGGLPDAGPPFDAGVRKDAGTFWDRPGVVYDGGAFDLAGAEAVLLLDRLPDGGTPARGEHLYKVTATGELAPVVTDLDLYHAFPVEGGLYVQAHFGTREHHLLVRAADGLAYDLPGAPFLGLSCQLTAWQLDNGDVALSNGQVYRRRTQNFSTLASPGRCNGVTFWASGNFLSAEVASATWKVFDVERNTSHYIQFCNTGTVTALTDAVGLVDDCDNKALMDLGTGARTSAGHFLQEGRHDATGAMFLSPSCPGTGQGPRLCHARADGVVTSWLTSPLTVLSVPWVVNERYAVVRETTQTTLVRKGVDAKVPIASGHDVVELALRGGTLYFLALQGNGKRTLGRVDLASGVTTPLFADLDAKELRALTP